MATSNRKPRPKIFTAEEALHAIIDGLDVIDGNQSEAEELDMVIR